MNHLKGFNKLNRTHSHRKALYRNMVTSLFKHERIMTTVAKAKEIRRVAEKLITRAKEKNLHNIRIVNKLIKNKDILMKLFNEIAPRYLNRKGGYTRIIKLPKMRAGDGSSMAYLELVEELPGLTKKKETKKITAEAKKQTSSQTTTSKTSGEEIKEQKQIVADSETQKEEKEESGVNEKSDETKV